MWSESQVTLYQQQKKLNYTPYSFISKVNIQETEAQEMCSGCVNLEFPVYYFKNTPTTKPKKYEFRTR